MATRYIAGEGMSDPGQPTTVEGQHTAEPTPQRIPQQGKMRVLYNTEDGTTRVEESRPSGARVSPSIEQASARNKAGMPIALSTAGPQDVITLPGMGDSDAQTWEQLGMIRKLATGGYEIVGQGAGALGEQPAAQQQKPAEKKVEEPAGDVTNVPGTSESSDKLLSTLQERAPMGLEGIIESISQGVVPETLYADIARQIGDENFAAKAETMHGEFLAAGQAALRNVGVTDPAAFETWARANGQEEVSSAVRDMVTGRSVSRLQSLGRAFVAQNNERLATLIQSKGVDAEVRNGEVFVSRKGLGLPPTPRRGDFGGSDSISLRDAIRAGYISFTK